MNKGGGEGRRGGGGHHSLHREAVGQVRFTKKSCLQASSPALSPPNVISPSLSPPTVHPSRRSFVLQGLGLDVVGDPPGSGQRQDGVVDGSHFHSQGDGVLVLAVHCAVILTHGRDKGSQPALRQRDNGCAGCSLPASGRSAPVGKGQKVG